MTNAGDLLITYEVFIHYLIRITDYLVTAIYYLLLNMTSSHSEMLSLDIMCTSFDKTTGNPKAP